MWRTLLILVEKGKSQDEVKLTKAGQRLYLAAGGKAEQARLPTLAAWIISLRAFLLVIGGS
jgi:hypothetical protein